MKQSWIKLGLIFDFNDYGSSFKYSTLPSGFWLSEHIIRIIFCTRNERNQSIPYFIDYDFSIKKILELPKSIKIELGELGTFDDSGIMPSCILQNNGEVWMYYIGWNLGTTVPFRNSIGLAVSSDNGLSFVKKFEGPILDRSRNEPHFVASNCVLFDENIYKMWYLSCTKWDIINGEITHYYHIKYATSIDGIDWNRNNEIAIDFKYQNEYAISVPRVIKENNLYRMWYSYRGGPKSELYRIGYAESQDGRIWNRKDEVLDLDVSETGWDSKMICYPFVFEYKNNKYMLYNGNGYGKTGIGLAILQK